MSYQDFTNHASNTLIESLANADEKSKIVSVKEMFIDFYVTDPEMFVFNLPSLVGNYFFNNLDLTDDGEDFKQVQRMFLN